MAMSKCRTIGLPNHRSAEPFKFCFAEENNIPKNTDTNLELNALACKTNNQSFIGTIQHFPQIND